MTTLRLFVKTTSGEIKDIFEFPVKYTRQGYFVKYPTTAMINLAIERAIEGGYQVVIERATPA